MIIKMFLHYKVYKIILMGIFTISKVKDLLEVSQLLCMIQQSIIRETGCMGGSSFNLSQSS